MSRIEMVIALLLLMVPGYCLAMAPGLQLQGQGSARYLGLIKVYDASLYSERAVSAENILNEDVSRCLQLRYAVALDVEDFVKGANTVLVRQHSAERLAQVQHEILSLHRAYQNVTEGDSYTLCYDGPSRTTTLALNGRQLVAIVSARFAELYFGIWLGPKTPLDDDLRDNLLAHKP